MMIGLRFKVREILLPALLAGAALLSGCFAIRTPSGGGQTTFKPPRVIRPDDIALLPGYRIEPVATGLIFPTGVTFDGQGRIYIVESGYSYGEAWATPRLLRIDPGKEPATIAAGSPKNGPWNGVTFHQGAFYIAEGGVLQGGRVIRVTPEGAITPLIENLPSVGDHHANGPVIGPDGLVYFGIGTFTNSGVVGEDNARFGWLARFPELHDIPCADITLTGENFESIDPLTPAPDDHATTGAFSKFGARTKQGEIIPGRVPCSGSVLRISPEGGKPELVAWGLRNPFGLAFSPGGALYVTDNSYDDRGSRPVHGAGDLLWAIRPGAWYGWPDFHGTRLLNDGDHHKPPFKKSPPRLIEKYPGTPPEPAAIFGVHSAATGFDFSRNADFGYVGQAFVAQFGDQSPVVGKVLSPVGFKVVRVDVATGVIEDFAVNNGKSNGPASRFGGGGLERPVAARFDPGGKALYVVDFGVMTLGEGGDIRLPFSASGPTAEPRKGTGVLWRITREGTAP